MSPNKVKVIDPNDTNLNLYAALLLYRSGQNQVFATSHDLIENANGRPVLGPGKPLRKEALAQFAESVADATAYRGMVPASLLYTAPDIIAWWTPAAKRRIWFKTTEKKIGTKSAEVMHLPLVFIATSSNWYVFVAGTNARPDANTNLYKAPYFNVYADGGICTGNVDLPGQIGPQSISAYEEAFFGSRFTHTNDDKLTNYKGGAYAMWAAQLKQPSKKIVNASVLIDRKETLEQAIKRIIPKGPRQ